MNLVRLLCLSAAALLAAGCAGGPDPSIDPKKKSFFVDVEYTVGTDGKTKDAKVISTDAPKQLQQEALREVSRYRADPSVDVSRGRRRIEYSVD
ncbi:energy transducer TonB [Luteolibacter arcticus]|uniref:Energy transducer TonB n=1 Tax=Luteolibacter arcticus TaxID=1581411 RepID=A0ABT3GPH3_9BACT|nr:energy transducer TonB [Luteolibacter arcticus]MCW1925426.1 energy transducer TonB [Luteolibacter arcticus]